MSFFNTREKNITASRSEFGLIPKGAVGKTSTPEKFIFWGDSIVGLSYEAGGHK